MTSAVHASRPIANRPRRIRTGGPVGSTPAAVHHTPVDMSGSVDPYLRDALQVFAEIFDVAPRVRPVEVSEPSFSFNNLLESSLTPFGEIQAASDSATTSSVKDDVVSVIRELEKELGLPLKDVLAAASIKKRTFHSWVSGTARAPQLRSQGQLWQLVDALEDIRDSVQGSVGTWLKSDTRRMASLRAGRLDELVDASLPARTADEYRPVRRGIADDVEMPVIKRSSIKVSRIKSDD